MKVMNWTSVLAVLLAVLIQGCALTPQNLHLDPEIDVQGEAVAVDTLVTLMVRDSRSSKVLGEVGDPNDPNQEMVDVTLLADQIGIIHASIAQLFLVFMCSIALLTSSSAICWYCRLIVVSTL